MTNSFMCCVTRAGSTPGRCLWVIRPAPMRNATGERGAGESSHAVCLCGRFDQILVVAHTHTEQNESNEYIN